MDRRLFVSALLDQVPDALVVTGLGSASYDVFAHGEREQNFYLWGAMGGSVPVGLGLALAQPERSVLVVTGDGEMLMGIGSLGSAAVRAPENLTVLVLDNGHFGETGMQRSHSGLGARLVDVARGFGIADCREVHSVDEVTDIASIINARNGLSFVQAHINTDEPPRPAAARRCRREEQVPRSARAGDFLMTDNTMQPYQLRINGRWCDSDSGESFDSFDPFTGKPWARIARGNAADVDDAVRAAHTALTDSAWAEMTASARGHLLHRLAVLTRQVGYAVGG